ncbi:hypothetical protein QIS99_03130 [Streptomyces sp. B-S-A8]|uniref:Uncharacterized protein n=1 Tax=Streptomyces solicavernae TaxID=3043614 RepID=A0ABT6RLN9_9ACTN|nr:hypothetical protein [Streptomyces sp. B-S-A8]MDI3385215.1 hypothetical protein [Streptomyces sp. B-S-A8]
MSREHHSAASLVADLKPERARLELAAGEVVLSHAFDTSYRTLDEPTARMFRLLGLLPHYAINAAAAASTAGVGQGEASLLLRNVADAHLIRHQDEHHYRWHDLLRPYATELAKHLDAESPGGRGADLHVICLASGASPRGQASDSSTRTAAIRSAMSTALSTVCMESVMQAPS